MRIRNTAQTGTGIQKGTRIFLWGIRLRGTTFEFEYLCEFETEFENNLGSDSGGSYGVDSRKNRGQKSRATLPLKSSQ
jgi:hypothetical protein